MNLFTKKSFIAAIYLLSLTATTEALENYTLTEHQTQFFLQHPQFLAYITQMQDGLTPDQIRDRFKLNQESHDFYINNLKRFGILVENDKGQIKFSWGSGPFNWRNSDEAFSLFVDTTLQQQFADKIIHELKNKNKDLHNKLGGFRLTPEQSEEMWTELQALILKYRQISIKNVEERSQDSLQRIMFNITLLENWKPPLLSKVENVTKRE